MSNKTTEELKQKIKEIVYGAYWYGEDTGDYNCNEYEGIREILDLIELAFQRGIQKERERIVKIIKEFIDPNPVFLEEHREKIFLKDVIRALTQKGTE